MEKENDILNSDKLDFELRCVAASEGKLPDAKVAFDEFKKRNSRQTGKGNARIFAMYASAAAACVAVFFILHALVPRVDDEPMIAYEATDMATGDITIKVNGKQVKLDSTDALNLGFTLNDEGEIIDCTNTTATMEVENAGDGNASYTEISVPACKTATITLPDGSKVWMDANSSISYPNHFADSEVRKVKLNGQAYFCVTHDEACPFVVDCGEISTTVLGTEFNISNIKGSIPQVALINGRVSVKSAKDEVVLKPEQMATLDADGNLDVEVADLEVVTSWKSGDFYFDGQSLRNIIIEVGRWYNMDVVIEKKEHINDCLHFNGERSWSVEETLQCLREISRANIEFKNNKIVVR